MKQPLSVRLVLAGAVVAILAGCSTGTASPTAAPTAAAPTTAAPTTAASIAAASSGPSAAASFDISALPPAEVTTIRFAEGGIDPGTFMLRLAMDSGLLTKYGLTGQEVTFNGATQVVQAMIAKQLDAAVSTSSQTILTQGTSDPAVDVAVFSTMLPDYLYAAKGLTTGADIKGKKAAVSTLGSQAYQEVIVGMQQLGLQPSDMTIVPIGGQSARIAALEAGTVAIAAADPALAPKLAVDGILPIVKLNELKSVELAGVNLMLLHSFVAANPGTTLRLVAAVLEATQLLFTNEPVAVAAYAKWAQLSEADAKAGLDIYIKSGGANRTLYGSDASYKTAQAVLVPITPAAAGYDLSKAHDFSFLDKLKAMGLDAQIGVPSN